LIRLCLAFRSVTIDGMKGAVCCFLLFAAGLGAQSTAKLDSDLTSLAVANAPIAAIANRLTDDILALAEKDAEPSRQTTLDFAVELAKTLAGKVEVWPGGGSLRTRVLRQHPPIQVVSSTIVEVLQSSGVASYRFHDAITRFREALIALNATAAQASSAANHLMILGQEVRGPEDFRLRK